MVSLDDTQRHVARENTTTMKNKLEAKSATRDWPPSRRLRLLLLILLAYIVLCTIVVCTHTDIFLYRLGFSLADEYDYIIMGNQFNYVMYVPRVAVWSGVAACFAFSFLALSLFAVPFKGSRYSLLDVLGAICLAFTALGASHVLLRLPSLRRYDWAHQPSIQRQVCEAAWDNKPEVLKQLISSGADPDSMLVDGQPDNAGALSLAVAENNDKCVDILLRSGATPEGAGAEFGFGITALDHAVAANNLLMVRKLLSAGADPNSQRSRAAILAFRNNFTEAAELLLQTGLSTRTFQACESGLKEDNNTGMLELLHKYKPRN